MEGYTYMVSIIPIRTRNPNPKQCNTVRMFKVHLREHIVNMSAF